MNHGGEEFVCLLNGVDRPGLSSISEQIRATVEALRIPHGTSSASPWVTVSVGAALGHPAHGARVADLVESADTQLFAAKRLGRNRVVLTDD